MSDISNANLELHTADLVQYVAHLVTDDCPRYLVVTLSCRLHSVTCHVIETDYVPHHTDRFEKWTLPTHSSNEL